MAGDGFGLEVLSKANAQARSQVAGDQLHQIFDKHKLVSAGSLALGAQFLQETGVASASVFQALSLNEQITLYGLVASLNRESAVHPTLQREAAQFAVTQAASPLEFVDYYVSYIVLSAKLDAVRGPAEKRQSLVSHALDSLAPCQFEDLDCPQVSGPLPPEDMIRVIRAWLLGGNRLGAPRVSAGIRQIIEFTAYSDETGKDAQNLVNAYLDQAKFCMSHGTPVSTLLGQDGASSLYVLNANDQIRGELVLDDAGCVTLHSLQQLDTGPTPPPTQPALLSTNVANGQTESTNELSA